MRIIHIDALKKVNAKEFSSTEPFPWVNFQALIPDDAFSELHRTFPDASLFSKSFGLRRPYGQKSHDRWELMEKPDLVLSPAWRDFIDDVKSSEYQEEIMRIFNRRNMSFFYWWQIARTGCAVSPHCDSANKIGSHLFYFNTESDWKDEWGGRTLILDDEKKMNEASAPEIENFKKVQAPEILGNKNLLFGRTPHSWHAVAPLTSPPEAARKIFTVIINRRPDLLKRSLSFMKRAMLPAPQKGQTMM